MTPFSKAFHISRAARDRYDFDRSIYQFTGNAVFADLRAAREFAQRMNNRRAAARNPDRVVRAGDLNAMGLIDELSHLVIRLYDKEMRRRGRIPFDRRVFSDALDYASQKLGPEAVYAVLARFTDHFPPVPVYRREIDLPVYLASHSVDALEELVMLWLENENPAFQPFDELFDDAEVAEGTAYRQVIEAIQEFFQQQPRFGPDDQTLVEMLQAPARAAPGSLQGQLEFIRRRWAPYFGEAFGHFLNRLLIGFDLIREDEKAAFGFGGPGPALVPTIEDLSGVHAAPSGDIIVVEYEAFTPDTDWMPRLVLLAKNTYVWLDQLSRKYQRAITRLDQVPDEELAQMASWGITGLWLIGLWERSRASQRIKQMMGAQDAVASAYSLYDYVIAEELGGEAALNHFKAQAWRHGIRLASDMVPNHMGIDSRWVIERPDYFLSLEHSPFPSYTFNGPDLSSDPRIGIFLEDHYYTRTDAAVVFKRLDRRTGDVHYIYHGNDGTSFPWNDTAQINYLNPEAREAVIQTIMRVARQFSIIRFDAAMTLAKRHVRRLWFPEPGTGGAIPSRAGHGMTVEEFDALMPNEFWREVVDRAAVEAPDTLLLAEAFWMLEGYFVRTLGMHRVYNSAFMNMLRDEKNGEYRQLIKNTIEFDPEILRRYVNFQNNPDEKTAVEQFGKGDKYFGVCVLMCTMPGLPMFGHGQIEGYTEKYGMEFRYPKLWERPDPDLVARHEREIFPLLKRRYLFAGVERFWLFDFYTLGGYVNEDVFAYSNASGDERVLVLYHNKFAEARGWIHTSAACAVKRGDDKMLIQTTLGKALGLHDDETHFTVFRDAISGLEFICSSQELCTRGLHIALRAYEYHVFDHIREVVNDAEHPYAELNARLQGRWVASVEEELEVVRLMPVTRAYRRLVDADWMRRVADGVVASDAPEYERLLDDVESRMQAVLEAIRRHMKSEDVADVEACRRIARVVRSDVHRLVQVHAHGALAKDDATFAAMLGWLVSRRLGELVSALDGKGEADPKHISRMWLTHRHLGDELQAAFCDFGLDNRQAWQAVTHVKLMMTYHDLLAPFPYSPLPASDSTLLTPNADLPVVALRALFDDPDARALLQVNMHNGVTYFNQEAFESLIAMLDATAMLDRAEGTHIEARALVEAAKAARYCVERLLAGPVMPDSRKATV